MGAALCYLHDMIRTDVTAHKALVSPLVQILKKTIEGRLGSEYYYRATGPPPLTALLTFISRQRYILK